ncbi:MAG TPA: hypothetical protein VEF89_16660 [Solirubrobacteraceae bacterium]|nr:hypothetical protein [Solirubrobacteraceae bacterium]
MNFSIFYDNRAQTDCDVNSSLTGDPPTGQQYGGYYVDHGPAGYHNGALYSDPRISMYIGMGLHQMPGDVWWRTGRTDPPQLCATDPAPSFDTGTGFWQTYTDPQSGKKFRSPQLRPERSALGRGAGSLCDAGAALPGLGDLAAEYG